ncbi:MAG: EamA family transporter, partial [Alphaproteobacteria bacterium]
MVGSLHCSTDRWGSVGRSAVPAFFRFLAATSILTAFMAITYFTGRREVIRQDLALLRKHWLKLAAIGILGHALFVSFVYFSLYTGQVPTVAVLQATMPAVVVAAGFVLFRDRLS